MLIHGLINELIFNIGLTDIEKIKSHDPIYINPIIEEAIKYIDKKYILPITVDDICAKLFISKSHLHHLFIENLNISPKKYINTKRVTKAQKLIRNGIKPNDAYLECGFSDYATFYRNYKMYFGHLPSEEINSVVIHTMKS